MRTRLHSNPINTPKTPITSTRHELDSTQLGPAGPKKLQVVARKGAGREIVYASTETRRAIWRMFFEHRRSFHWISRTLHVPHTVIAGVIHAQIPELINRAVISDRMRRGPQGPGPAAPGLRRAA